MDKSFPLSPPTLVIKANLIQDICGESTGDWFEPMEKYQDNQKNL